MPDKRGSHSLREGASPSYAWRITGAALLLLVAIPFYRLAAGNDSDRIAGDVVDAANVTRTLLLLGTFIALTVGVVASKILGSGKLERAVGSVGRWLGSIPGPLYAASLAVLAAAFCLLFSVVTLEGKPNLIDAMVQLTQARYVAAGKLAGPVNAFAEFWHLPNSLATPNGWVAQYPPGHIALLAVGMMIGTPVIVGPVLAGVTVFFTALTSDRLFPDDRTTARLGALMLALSPFLLGLAGAFMNHVAAAAFISIAVYAALRRAQAGNFAWTILAGAAVGAAFTIRPLTAVVAALVVAAIWIIWYRGSLRESLMSLFVNTAGAVVGVAPFIVAMAAYNQHFFGNPFRFGYTALVGPLVRPGFHRDPSGHVYGVLQALEYTSSDLTLLSMYLLETPLPACAVVAFFLIFARRLSPGAKVVAFWALAPVIANALYWHHGFFMGPRMLNEWTPAWVLLTAVAAVGLVKSIPANLELLGYVPRAGVAIAFLLAWLTGVLYLGPQRLARYGGSYLESSRMRVPPVSAPALIFVHGGWSTRIAMRLTAHGMRGDSVEAAFALNPTCDVQAFADWYASNPRDESAAPRLNFDFASTQRPQKLEVAKGDEIRYYQGVPFGRRCQYQVASDTLGIIDIAPLEWQNDLPGLGEHGAMIVRDMGPRENAKLIAQYRDRVPMILMRREKEGRPELVAYDTGVRILWPNEGN
ncbi:MAG TPA: glycosyltransferase family 39 protein [Gemmatimonadaceae bacterium]